jgi:hypothetical protein
MVAVAAVALAFGGLLWLIRPEPVELAPQPSRVSVDHDIFDVVLLDLLDNEEFHGGSRGSDSEIVLADTTLRGGVRSSPLGLSRNHLIEELEVPSELLDDLAARNSTKARYSLALYHPSSPRIHVKTHGRIQTYLPAYSRDGLSALLLFAITDTPHGAAGCYLLKKVDGRWMVVKRRIYYFA